MQSIAIAALFLASLAPVVAMPAATRAVALDPGSAPLNIVATGTNAPETLERVFAAGPVRDGLELVYAYAGPCRSRVFRTYYFKVRTPRALRPGDLFFKVPVMRGSARSAFALRRATPTEEAKYASCRWDA